MNLRRSFPFLMLTLLLVGAGACEQVSSHFSKKHGSKAGSSEGGSYSAEAERTREMEEKAEDINRQAEDLRNMEGSDQDKIDAYNKMQESQQELNSMAEGEGGN
jgi:hypothetical protein